jgi:hypothetical protein
MNNPMIEKASTLVAAGSAASPWLLPTLKNFSEAAAVALPILGVTWLLIQIGAWLWKHK